MATEIRLPQYGMTMHEATLLSWLKAVGDPIQEGEPIAELETDKMTVELEAPASGVLASIAAQAGETVAVLAVLGMIE
jgi:2-oxoglutarate dehydrogenase E2 component (dihydrolipoamide succinyltransferase)